VAGFFLDHRLEGVDPGGGEEAGRRASSNSPKAKKLSMHSE
jgi:hypothetical protein